MPKKKLIFTNRSYTELYARLKNVIEPIYDIDKVDESLSPDNPTATHLIKAESEDDFDYLAYKKLVARNDFLIKLILEKLLGKIASYIFKSYKFSSPEEYSKLFNDFLSCKFGEPQYIQAIQALILQAKNPSALDKALFTFLQINIPIFFAEITYTKLQYDLILIPTKLIEQLEVLLLACRDYLKNTKKKIPPLFFPIDALKSGSFSSLIAGENANCFENSQIKLDPAAARSANTNCAQDILSQKQENFAEEITALNYVDLSIAMASMLLNALEQTPYKELFSAASLQPQQSLAERQKVGVDNPRRKV